MNRNLFNSNQRSTPCPCRHSTCSHSRRVGRLTKLLSRQAEKRWSPKRFDYRIVGIAAAASSFCHISTLVIALARGKFMGREWR